MGIDSESDQLADPSGGGEEPVGAGKNIRCALEGNSIYVQSAPQNAGGGAAAMQYDSLSSIAVAMKKAYQWSA